MKYFDAVILEELKGQADIASVIQAYLPVKRTGNSYKCVCPFHNDHSPSMHITPSMGIYKCFACGAGGDVIKFVQEHDRIEFPAAVERVAELTGYQLPEKETMKEGASRDLTQINEFSAYFFYNQLKAAPQAVEYLKNRGLSAETCATFKLGWAPDSWDMLMKSCKEKGYKEDALIEAGVVVQNEKGKVYDKFRSRLMFPIFNLSKKVIAFGGRVLDPEQKPKYLNSPETRLYHKSEVLYGLSHTKPDIMKEKSVIFVEGYMDMLQLFQAGVTNVVSVSGTALTADHAKLIKRYTNRAYLVFDGDEAGQNAARKSIETLLHIGIEVKVLLLPEGEDPDSIVKSHGADHFRGLLKRAFDFVDFTFNGINPRTLSPESKAQYVSHMKGMLKQIHDVVARQEYIKKIAERLDIKESFLAQTMRVQANEIPASPERTTVARTYDPVELRLLTILLHNEYLVEIALNTFDIQLVQTDPIAELLDFCFCLFEEEGEINLKTLYDKIPAELKQLFETIEEPVDLSSIKDEHKNMIFKDYVAHLLQLELVFLKELQSGRRDQTFMVIQKGIREIAEQKQRLAQGLFLPQDVLTQYLATKKDIMEVV
ncbi:MAG: DNA primase [Fibrobacterales bacterium]